MRVLLVEDDRLLGDGLSAGLRQDGYAVDWIRRGDEVLPALENSQFDLMILDLGLPGMDGTEVIKQVRKNNHSIPILILTARGTLEDRISGLDIGADDYMVKPVDIEELNARLRALSRRSYGKADPVLGYGDILLDPASHTVTRAGQGVELSPKEFSILHILIQQPGKIVPRSRLEESLYGWNESIASNAIEVHIHHLRKKLGTELIETIRGVGYVIGKMLS